MNDITEGEKLPGYRKKSFLLPYNGGEIWFEHLDGIYAYETLVLKKLAADAPFFTRPSSSSYICFVFDETEVTRVVADAVASVILGGTKRFMKVAFSGLDRKNERLFKRILDGKGFGLGFFEGLEDAKEWLLP